MAIDDQLAVLLAQNADLFAAYEEWANGQIMLLAGTVDDPNSFNEAGGKTGALGYYPVVNVSGQTIYVACVARLKAIALGGANAAVLEGLVGQVGGKLAAADAAIGEALTAGGFADDRGGYAKTQGDYAKAKGDQIGDIQAAVTTATAAAAAIDRFPSIAKTSATNGRLDSAGAGVTWVGGTPPIAAINETNLAALNIGYATNLATLNISQGSFYKIQPPRTFHNNSFFATSVFIWADNWDWLGNATHRIQTYVYRLGSGTPQQFDMKASYVSITDNLRRFFIAGQMTQLTTDLDYASIVVLAPANRTAVVRASGYAGVFSEQKLGGVDWADFDPYEVTATKAKLASTQADLIALQSRFPVPPSVPDALLPSSFHLIKGRPLELFKPGFMASREASQHDVAFVGLSEDMQPQIEPANPRARLDGARLSGQGAVRFEPTGIDDYPISTLPVRFFTTPAAKTGSPKILHIRDSLGHQDTIFFEKQKLIAAGMTPVYLGTKLENNGVPCEARSSWPAAAYVNRVRNVNQDGSGIIYPLRTGAGSGATFTAVLSGGSVAIVNITNAGSGYDDNPALPIVFSGGGVSNNKTLATAKIVGGQFVSVTVQSCTTAYLSVPTVSVPANTTEYLALPANQVTSGRWLYNPFVRPATPDETAANDPRIVNGYIFDFAYYLARFAISTPDIVQIGLMMNDVTAQARTVLARITGNVMTLVGAAGGPIGPGTVVYAAGVKLGTMIMQQLSGVSGAVGSTYLVSIAQTTAGSSVSMSFGLMTPRASFTATIFGVANTVASNVMAVSNVALGTLRVGDIVTAVGVIPGTYIARQLTGTAGGAGTYLVSNVQLVGSALDMSTTSLVAADYVKEAHGLIVPSIRAAGVTGAIFIHTYGRVIPGDWQRMVHAIRAILMTYNGQEANRLFILPVHAVVHPKVSYGMNVQATDQVTGLQTGYPVDFIHPDLTGKHQTAELSSGGVMAQYPPQT